MNTSTLSTTDPTTGESRPTDIGRTPDGEVDRLATAAASAFGPLVALGRKGRAVLVERMAEGLESRRAELVDIAIEETGLAEARLDGELTRSIFQLRLFADVLREGSYLEATIDHAGATPVGPGPDLRRMLAPIGPIAVFGSSNFPFAFSVPGGDTASALAAGCPVILKAHGSHPLTSRLAFEVLSAAATAAGAPAGTIGIVYGTEAGAALVAHPHIRAVGFTGSLGGGEALLAIIERRPEPIPFYGELSSVNPLIVTRGAAAARASDIATGLFASFTGSAGQFCTKPGVAFIPAGEQGDILVSDLSRYAREAAGQPLLNRRILDSYGEIRDRLTGHGGAETLVAGSPQGAGFSVTPTVLQIDADRVTPAVTEEAFGPLVVVVRYRDQDDLARGLAAVPRSLTVTIHAEDDESDELAAIHSRVIERAGRVVVNGYPTGVRVAWAQHHGGPWPSTNSLHTSVGPTAIRRFLRPIAWQSAPDDLLPEELRDGPASVPRRVDGRIELPEGY